jgi:hypothetical protein
MDFNKHVINLIVDENAARMFDPRHDKTCPNLGFAATLKKVHRLLGPGGRFLICTSVSRQNAVGAFISPAQIQTMAENAGFYFDEYEEVENPHGDEHSIYMLELRK